MSACVDDRHFGWLAGLAGAPCGGARRAEVHHFLQLAWLEAFGGFCFLQLARLEASGGFWRLLEASGACVDDRR